MSERKKFITNPVVRQVLQSNTIQVYYLKAIRANFFSQTNGLIIISSWVVTPRT